MSDQTKTITLTDLETGDSLTVEPATAGGGGGPLVSLVTPSPGIVLTPTQVRRFVRHMEELIGDRPSPEADEIELRRVLLEALNPILDEEEANDAAVAAAAAIVRPPGLSDWAPETGV